MLQVKKETVNIWECKVDNNANITNFVHLWKTRIEIYHILIYVSLFSIFDGKVSAISWNYNYSFII